MIKPSLYTTIPSHPCEALCCSLAASATPNQMERIVLETELVGVVVAFCLVFNGGKEVSTINIGGFDFQCVFEIVLIISHGFDWRQLGNGKEIKMHVYLEN